MHPKLTPARLILISTILYCGVTAVFFHQNLPLLTTELIGPPEDNMQDLWNIWYSQQLSSIDVRDWFFTNRLFYPEGTSLLYHSFAYSDLVFIRLTRFLLGLPLTIPVLVALHNITLLASFIFSGLAMYMVALSISPIVSTICMSQQFSSFRFSFFARCVWKKPRNGLSGWGR
jgi:hypothetical protein